MTSVEWLSEQIRLTNIEGLRIKLWDAIEQAKEMEKEQRGYSEEEVRLAYQKGEEDSYLKGGQTKEMENEFMESLKQKQELNKSE